MKIIGVLLIVLVSFPSMARQIVLEDGKTYQIEQGDQILCKQREKDKCQVDFEYVGKKYVVKAPNGRIHGQFIKDEEALTKAQSLVALSVCEQVVLNYDDKALR